jgi:tetraacyldisaccharide 4'-kinase
MVGADGSRPASLQNAETRRYFSLDDGFQHRRLHRDCDIVAIDPAEWNAGEALLPIGRWREPKAAITRAHAACVQEMAGTDMPSLPIPTFLVRTQVEGLFKNDAPFSETHLAGRAVVAFAGIAKPQRFFETLPSIGINPIKTVAFADHHAYSRRDIERLGGDVLVTTEKDAVRLAGRNFPDFVYLRISAKISKFEQLLNLIQERLPKL